MRFMVIVKATPGSEAGELPSEAVLTAMTAFNERLVAAGVMVDGNGLHPTSRGAHVHFEAGGGTRTEHGPFADAPGLIAGYWILECASLEECIGWVEQCPRDEHRVRAGDPPGLHRRRLRRRDDARAA
jgi:hypothetical protein